VLIRIISENPNDSENTVSSNFFLPSVSWARLSDKGHSSEQEKTDAKSVAWYTDNVREAQKQRML
jgi:hypothetical protein